MWINQQSPSQSSISSSGIGGDSAKLIDGGGRRRRQDSEVDSPSDAAKLLEAVISGRRVGACRSLDFFRDCHVLDNTLCFIQSSIFVQKDKRMTTITIAEPLFSLFRQIESVCILCYVFFLGSWRWESVIGLEMRTVLVLRKRYRFTF